MNSSGQPSKQNYQGLIGAFSSFTVSCFLQPLEIIKMHIIINPLNSVKLQKNHFFWNLTKSAQYIYRYEGFKGFYRGIYAALIRNIFASSMYFQVLSIISSRLRQNAQDRVLSDFTSSFFARGQKYDFIVVGLANFLSNPMLVVETRQQIPGQNEYKGVINSIMKLQREEGSKVFFRGAWTCTVKEACFAGIYYVIFQQLKSYLNKKQGKFVSRVQIQFTSGMMAGIIGTVISHPFEIIRARLQAGALDHNSTHTYSGVYNGVMKIYKTEGMEGYLKGLAPRLLRKPLANTLTFVMVDQINQLYFGAEFDQ